MKAVFTIVAKNYIGLAEVLGQSVKNHSNADFFIVVADEFLPNDPIKNQLNQNILIAKDILKIPDSLWNEMSFKYNLVEFCTSIKASCFQYFFNEKKYDKVIFTDPDVYFFNSLNLVFSELEHHSILLTPHILELQEDFKGDYPDYLFLVNGTFNLGFLGLSAGESTQRFLKWWHNRLVQYCFFDNEKGMATDQKWINMIPSFFSPQEMKISFNKGMNVAPWNFHERKIIDIDDVISVTERENNINTSPLLFVHFSGFDYKSILEGRADHKNEKSSSFPDYDIVFEKYAEALKNNSFTKYIGLQYSYNYFKNGIQILSIHRRIYRRLLQEGKLNLNPFETNKGSYFEQLRMKKLLDHSIILADKITNKNIKGFDKKMGYVNVFFTIIKSLIGIKRYSILVRFFRRYFSEENQVFLYDKELGKKIW